MVTKKEARRTRQDAVDAFTNLLSKVGFREALKRVLRRIKRRTARYQALVVIFLDCDNFKKINTLFGNVVGDDAIGEIANRLRTGFRSSDLIRPGVIGRDGGDEFCLCIPIPDDVDLGEMIAIFEDRLVLLQQERWAHRGTVPAGIPIPETIPLYLSAGIYVVHVDDVRNGRVDGKMVRSILERVNIASRMAKAGKDSTDRTNGVVRYTEEVQHRFERLMEAQFHSEAMSLPATW